MGEDYGDDSLHARVTNAVPMQIVAVGIAVVTIGGIIALSAQVGEMYGGSTTAAAAAAVVLTYIVRDVVDRIPDRGEASE